MPTGLTPALTLAAHHDRTSADPLTRAAASGRSITDASRLFGALTAGDDFGGLDRLVDDLAKARSSGHLGESQVIDAAARIVAALPEPERSTFQALSSTWGDRMACAIEVGFHAGFAAGRAK